MTTQKDKLKEWEKDLDSLWNDLEVINYPQEALTNIKMWIREFLLPKALKEERKKLETQVMKAIPEKDKESYVSDKAKGLKAGWNLALQEIRTNLKKLFEGRKEEREVDEERYN
jgi:hypothetical protein